MGCLNSEGKFAHWFANIHFSGPCNRSCYFCIGQHMMALDPLNNLNRWPLPGMEKFVESCLEKNIKEINLTGSNTDPLLYEYFDTLVDHLRREIPGAMIGLRTNAVLEERLFALEDFIDELSVSVHSLNPYVYKNMMGSFKVPNIQKIVKRFPDLKINMVLGPENIADDDYLFTINQLEKFGVKKINLREPYGQPRIGNPLASKPDFMRFGMPVYNFGRCEVMYWDVHYVEVESVNLYANGIVSTTYPVTKGHHQKGTVKDQSYFAKSGRQQEQWLSK